MLLLPSLIDPKKVGPYLFCSRLATLGHTDTQFLLLNGKMLIVMRIFMPFGVLVIASVLQRRRHLQKVRDLLKEMKTNRGRT